MHHPSNALTGAVMLNHFLRGPSVDPELTVHHRSLPSISPEKPSVLSHRQPSATSSVESVSWS